MDTPEPDLLPLSALQHLLYCERQCALIHVEQAWAENRFTAEGRVMHERAHEGAGETRPGLRMARGLHVRSLALGLSGQCDVVEFHADGTILPVEYKRGQPKAHRADDVQVCAQAVCLEEMRGLAAGSITRACLFYGQPRRRHEVVLDDDLRRLTAGLARRLHDLVDSGLTPPATYDSDRCGGCSLLDLCQPKALRFKQGAGEWFESNLKSQI